ncbi:N-acetyllactosaminide beta-1,6-N-acetylglucosaminyl-transferase [Aplysia californica]|uniref:N-acetyllactosaminide beta-1,6-N-acetylglucosaminyl-transferase n=1 Tax=Aplysia californica TaxID=6500 RepID=A0ABM0JKD8_APLCA|nr:N-acetyllactosaminide beta-1,6-N-acetylglucosaminyl-transferase [Aplysia californica]
MKCLRTCTLLLVCLCTFGLVLQTTFKPQLFTTHGIHRSLTINTYTDLADNENRTGALDHLRPSQKPTKVPAGHPSDWRVNELVASRLEQISNMHRERRVDCAAVIRNNKTAMAEAISVAKNLADTRDKNFNINIHLMNQTQNCSHFLKEYGFITDVLSKEEEEFPIAYSLVAYTDTETALRLLRSIYRVQNVYCIHVDISATSRTMGALTSVVSCLPNAFISSRRVNVQWGHFTVLEAELICLQDLWRHKKWKYFINLTGQEFPLKNNFELVKILKSYKGANDVHGTIKYRRLNRWNFQELPHNLTGIKGWVHVSLSRPFVDFTLHDPRSQDLLDFLKGTWIPDESFFSTLNHNTQLGIPGSFVGLNETEQRVGEKPTFNRYKMWGRNPCAKNTVRDICILSTGDLPRMVASDFLFANKFFLNEDRVVIGCLEERLMNKTRDYYMGRLQFNTSVYENSVIVKNRIRDETGG